MKELIIIILTFSVMYLAYQLDKCENKLNAAQEYITALEDDFPEYIDITSGCDAYSNWYELK